MANLTVKNIPDDLYQRLKEGAAERKRSINSEVIDLIEQGLTPQLIDVEEMLTRIRAVRKQNTTVYLTDECINAAKNEGRP